MQSRDVAQLKAAIREAEGVLTEGDLAEARKALREEQAEARAVLSAALQSDDGEAPRRTLDEGARTGLPDDELEAAKACQEVSLGECVTTVQQQLHGLVSQEVSLEEAVTTAPFVAAALPSSPSAATCQEILNGLTLHLQTNRERVMIPASRSPSWASQPSFLWCRSSWH